MDFPGFDTYLNFIFLTWFYEQNLIVKGEIMKNHKINHHLFAIFVLLSLFTFSSISMADQGGVSDAEYNALVALYNSTDGDNWTNNTNWLSANPVETWYGVGVSNYGHVNGISLQNNQLTGTIPPEIGDLGWLKNLYLPNNQLSGSIPAAMRNLGLRMKFLDLSNNQLSGEIPYIFDYFDDLVFLNLGSNQFTGSLTDQFRHLGNLYLLDISHNQLSGSIPRNFLLANDSLERLYLNDNQLTGPIPWFSYYFPIGEFYLQNNQLSGRLINVFKAFAPDLYEFNVSNNDFTAIFDVSDIDRDDTSIDATINVADNRLTFEDIEPILLGGYSYINSSRIYFHSEKIYFFNTPQKNIGQELYVNVEENLSHTYSVSVGGSNNQYQWYKNGFAITGETDDFLTFPSVSTDDIGTYTCEITNTKVTNTVLYSNPYHLNIGEILFLSLVEPIALVESGYGTESFDVLLSGEGDFSWTAEVEGSSTSWLSFSGASSGNESGSLEVSYVENMSEARLGKVNVNAVRSTDDMIEETEETILIIQPSSTCTNEVNLNNVTIGIGQEEVTQACNTITAENYVVDGNGSTGGLAVFIAGDSITLKPGFQAEAGSRFHAMIY